MPTQYPFGTPNDRYKQKLFVDTGFSYVEVDAKIINPYSPPVPQPNVKEIKIVNAPSHFHHLGLSSYKVSLNLLFQNKQAYENYLMYVGWTHKFYDEKGQIYLGAVENIKSTAHEANNRYRVELELVMVKKDQYDRHDRFQFQDVEENWAYEDIQEMANLGLITVMTVDGDPMLYFRPDDYCTRAEFVVFLMRTKRLMERMIRV